MYFLFYFGVVSPFFYGCRISKVLKNFIPKLCKRSIVGAFFTQPKIIFVAIKFFL